MIRRSAVVENEGRFLDYRGYVLIEDRCLYRRGESTAAFRGKNKVKSNFKSLFVLFSLLIEEDTKENP